MGGYVGRSPRVKHRPRYIGGRRTGFPESGAAHVCRDPGRQALIRAGTGEENRRASTARAVPQRRAALRTASRKNGLHLPDDARSASGTPERSGRARAPASRRRPGLTSTPPPRVRGPRHPRRPRRTSRTIVSSGSVQLTLGTPLAQSLEHRIGEALRRRRVDNSAAFRCNRATWSCSRKPVTSSWEGRGQLADGVPGGRRGGWSGNDPAHHKCLWGNPRASSRTSPDAWRSCGPPADDVRVAPGVGGSAGTRPVAHDGLRCRTARGKSRCWIPVWPRRRRLHAEPRRYQVRSRRSRVRGSGGGPSCSACAALPLDGPCGTRFGVAGVAART